MALTESYTRMNQPDNILNELRELSPTVAGINRVNVFTVPDGYFESLAGLLLINASAANSLQSAGSAISAVPEGYFDNLAGNILNRIKREVPEETNAISELVAGIGRKNIYSVPAGYFNNLPAQLVAQLSGSLETVAAETASTSSLVAGIGKQNVYSLPEGYFNNFETSVRAKLFANNTVQEETATISELVAGIGSRNIFNVPQDYFENLVVNKVEDQKPVAKVISMKSRTNVFRYAAAAVVTGVIALSAFFMLNNNSSDHSKAQVAVMKEANKIIETNSFETEMNNISDAAIVAFLENKGENVEASLVASLVDDKNLPEADEYLLNDNTLDEILNSLDLNN